MASNDTNFGVKTTYDNGLNPLVEQLKSIPGMLKVIQDAMAVAFDIGAKAAQRTADIVVAQENKTVAVKQQTVAKVREIAQTEVSAQERAQAAITAANQRYADLRKQYEFQNVDAVRGKIMALEEQTRYMRQARANETDNAVRKELQAEVNKVNTELQLYRSLEKEKTGLRTATEIAEAHGAGGGMGGILANLKHEVTAAGGPIDGLTSKLGPLKNLSFGAAGGFAAAGTALVGLFEKGMEKAERMEELKIGFMSQGQSAEQAAKSVDSLSKSSQKVSRELLVNKADLDTATAAYLKLGGSTKDLGTKQQDIAALSKKAGIDMESAGKMLAKATDPENQKNLSKFGINLSGVTDEAERSRIIHEKLKGTLEGMKEAADGPLGGYKRLQMTISEVTGTLGSLVFEAAGPFLQILSEIAKVAQEYLLPVLKVVIQTAFFPLKVAIEVVTGVLRGIIGTAIAVFEWFGKVTGATTFLTNAWDAISKTAQRVVEWFNKAKDTVSNLGSSLTKLLGISSESTQQAEELAKAREKEKDAADAVRESTDKYTESLAKNQQEASASAKQAQDNSISAIIDIKNRLKTATGAERTALEERLQQWTAYGKKNAALQEEQEKERHEASIAIGAARDAEDKTAINAAKKTAKEREDAARASADIELQLQKDKIALSGATEKQRKSDEAQAEIDHAQTLLNIARQYHADRSKEVVKATADLSKARAVARKAEQDDLLADAKSDTDQLMREFELRVVQEGISDKDAALGRQQILRTSLQNEIALRRSFGEDVSKLESDLAMMDAKSAQDQIKERRSVQAQLAQLRKDGARAGLEIMKANGASEAEIRREELRLNTIDENERYKASVEAKRAEISDKQLLRLLEVSMEADHNNKLEALRAKSDQQDIAARKQLSGELLAFTLNENADRLKMANDFADKRLGIQGVSLLKEQAGFRKFLEANLLTLIQNYVAQQATTTVGENTKTALTTAGFIARQATYVAEGIASAASAAGTWIATASKAVYNAFELLPFPLDIVAAGGAVAGVYGLSRLVMGMFPGHKEGTDASPGGWHWVGEDGPELMNVKPGAAVIPNHRIGAGGQSIDLAPLVRAMGSVERSVNRANNTFAMRPAPVLPVNDHFLGALAIASKAEDRASL